MQRVLNLTIDAADLRVILEAGEKVLVASSVDGEQANVAWIAFSPLQANSVQWEEAWGLYASSTQVHDGVPLVQTSEVRIPAQEGLLYPLKSFGSFGPPTKVTSPERGTFYASNEMPASSFPSLTFGLTKNAVVNGVMAAAAAINAQVVPAMQNVAFTPGSTVWVWLSSGVTAQTVVGKVFSSQTEVTFGPSVAERSLVYDSAVGRFVAAR